MITVDKTKCITGGLCVEVCPSDIIELGENGPVETSPRLCIACGHCVAVCPVAALDHDKAPLGGQDKLDESPVLDPETAKKFLRARRSIRAYRKDLVPKDKIEKMLDVARMAPTGSNSQGTSFIVVSDPAILEEAREIIISFIEDEIAKGSRWARGYRRLVTLTRKKGKDVILRGAPQLVIALADKSKPLRWPNGQFALTYAELMAPSLGIGTCWAGFLLYGLKEELPRLMEIFQIPEDKKVTAAIMIGVPKVRYQRLVERAPLETTWL